MILDFVNKITITMDITKTIDASIPNSGMIVL